MAMIPQMIIVFPTWVIIKVAIPFLPDEHPFNKKRISLYRWAAYGTPLLYSFGMFFWVAGITLAGLTLKIYLMLNYGQE